MKWERVTIDSISKVVTKGTTPTTIGFNFAKKGIPFLRVQNIQNSVIDDNDILFIDETANKALSRSVIKPGDVLITIAGTIGRTAVVPVDAPPMNCNQAVAIIRFCENVNPYYFSYWLNTKDAIEQITGSKVTATISNLSLGCIKELQVPLPPLEEQHRIAAILDKADAIRRKRFEAIRLTEELLRAVFLDMFGDPVSNPKWEVVNLGEHLSFVTTGPRGWAKYYSDVGERFIRSLDVRMNFISTDDAVFVNPPNNAEAKRACVKNDDVLLTMTGSRIGRVAPVPKGFKTGYISQHVAILRPLQTILPRYLSFFLSLPSGGQRQIASMQYGQTKPGLNLNQVCSFQVPLPPIEKQQEFDTFWLRYELSLNNQKTALAKSHNLFNSLMHRAFRGEL